jgi:uncharacterized repeat protein (TIGR01451 family)
MRLGIWRRRTIGGARTAGDEMLRAPRPPRRALGFEQLETRAMLSAATQPHFGILLMNSTAQGALTNSGSGGIHVTGGGSIVVNSTSGKAAIQKGAGNVTAAMIDLTGGMAQTGKGKFQAQIQHSAADFPYELYRAPPPAANGPVRRAAFISGNGSVTLAPGTYVGGIHLSQKAKVILRPGVYYLQGGGLSVTEYATLQGQGVTIFNAPLKSTDRVVIRDHAMVNLTAPSAGQNQDVVLGQRANVPIVVQGGAVKLVGKVYAAFASLNFSSNWNFNVTGNAKLGINGGLILDKIVNAGIGRINVDATINARTDLTVTTTNGSDVSVPGQSTTYTVTVANRGTHNVYGVQVHDVLPASLINASYEVQRSSQWVVGQFEK